MTTNREKLAKMTNEELAEFLSNGACKYCYYKEDCSPEPCSAGILKWLNQESEE